MQLRERFQTFVSVRSIYFYLWAQSSTGIFVVIVNTVVTVVWKHTAQWQSLYRMVKDCIIHCLRCSILNDGRIFCSRVFLAINKDLRHFLQTKKMSNAIKCAHWTSTALSHYQKIEIFTKITRHSGIYAGSVKEHYTVYEIHTIFNSWKKVLTPTLAEIKRRITFRDIRFYLRCNLTKLLRLMQLITKVK